FTAFILFLTVSSLFTTPRLKGKYEGSRYFVALLTAFLWAAHPIQTQAVTYIVQRMATMAAMFYILALFLYIKGRLTRSRVPQAFLYVACLLSFALAMGSKQNAATLPAALFFVEMIFFQDMSVPQTRRRFLLAAAGAGTAVIIFGVFLFMNGDMLSFLKGYNNRPFTLFERLLTEPRILVFHLSQLFYPVASRFSIDHDIIISTSLFQPWTTLPAILFLLFLIVTSLFQVKKRPILAFAILFFFLNHVIESSIIPLELIFEHRNYLPSLFIFFPVSIGIKRLLDHYRQRERVLYVFLVSLVSLLFVMIGIGTYTRNGAWATEKSLLEDAVAKAPMSHRPVHNLAYNYYEKIGDYGKAYKLYGKALSLESTSVTNHRALALSNMANILIKKQEYEGAIGLFKKVLEIDPKSERSLYNMILALVKTGRLEEASGYADLLLSKRNDHIYYQLLKGLILVRQDRPEEALSYFQRTISMDPSYGKALLYKGIALSLMGKHKRADLWLRRAMRVGPNNIGTLFCAIENSVKAGWVQRTDMYVERLFSLFALENISRSLVDIPGDMLAPPISQAVLAPVIAQRLEEKAKKVEGIGKR
ncbi:MAG: tetratricopeptide repeat protein, partial [Thermodesulfobacteriota bacterium]|nr:tetratricopeptide repeat protein [Thermodesulfobacteriota bacterium]